MPIYLIVLGALTVLWILYLIVCLVGFKLYMRSVDRLLAYGFSKDEKFLER